MRGPGAALHPYTKNHRLDFGACPVEEGFRRATPSAARWLGGSLALPHRAKAFVTLCLAMPQRIADSQRSVFWVRMVAAHRTQHVPPPFHEYPTQDGGATFSSRSDGISRRKREGGWNTGSLPPNPRDFGYVRYNSWRARVIAT
jgi:hypothetical protein